MYFNDIRPMQGSRASQARGLMIEMRDINIRVDSRIMSIWKIEIDYRHEKVKKILTFGEATTFEQQFLGKCCLIRTSTLQLKYRGNIAGSIP